MPGPVIEPFADVRTRVGSPNKVIIGSLVSTLQKEVKPEKLYDALRKMNQDLNKIYEALFDGPLPAVDGYNLTRINAAVLNGPIPESYNLAYKDRLNHFVRGQQIVYNDVSEPFWTFGFGSETADPVVVPSSYMRIGSKVDEEFFISQNMFWTGAAWDFDSATGSLRLDFINGEILAWWYDAVLLDLRKTFHLKGKELFVENFAQTGDISIYRVDDYDVVRLGDSALANGTTPNGWPSIPNTAAANLPVASATPTTNGVIGIDATNFRFVFYTNNARYYVAGTAF